MSRETYGSEGTPKGADSKAIPGGWFGYAPLPDGRGEPPDEAYSRVTNSERFRSLHGAALGLVERLKAEYDVEMSEGYELGDFGVSREELARPTIMLCPNDTDCAPITVAFTDFPGVIVGFGKWKEEPFPNCGCDACDEDTDGETESMTEMFESVMTGGFLEAVRIPRFLGDGWVGSAFADTRMPMTEKEGADRLERARIRGRLRNYKVFRGERLETVLSSYERMSERRVERTKALDMTGGRLYLEFNWKPWPRRRKSPDGATDV